MRQRYDDLTIEVFSWFERGEEDVAYWVAVEFYAGWAEPTYSLYERGVPHLQEPGGWPHLTIESMGSGRPGGWQPPRGEMLIGWANNKEGPRYGELFSSGDHSRHHIVTPNGDVNSDMLLPPLWTLAKRERDLSSSARRKWWRPAQVEPAPSTRAEIESCAVCSIHGFPGDA
jgi:hypothetical protein